MIITQQVINQTFCKITGISNADFLSTEGFEVLADWSEQQEWWNRFAIVNDLGSYWRPRYADNPHLFALKLYRFVADWWNPTGNDVSDAEGC